jgi:N-acetylmuramoyl-L-alanine amidase
MTVICLSAGHSAKCPGAADILDEFAENRRMVAMIAARLTHQRPGCKCYSFVDMTSRDQNTNLNTIVDWHNSIARDLDVSIHFNCSNQHTTDPRGTEVLYVTQNDLAGRLSAAIAGSSGLINRGPKLRNDLFFLNNTEMPAVLIEVCFVDSEADCDLYAEHFDSICEAIAGILSNVQSNATAALLDITGKVSSFGGPLDTGVAPDEGLAFIDEISDQPALFLPAQPVGTTGLARRLDPAVDYVACRWDYERTPRDMLLREMAWVGYPGGRGYRAYPADWGPHMDTGRVADISPGLMHRLGIVTDDIVRVIFPFPKDFTEQPPPPMRPGPLPPRVYVNIETTPGINVGISINGEPILFDLDDDED